jgi:hypothetical protein
MLFSPSQGSVTVPAGKCVSKFVNLPRPVGLPPFACPGPDYGPTCYQLMVTNTGSGKSFSCNGRISSTCKYCAHPSPPPGGGGGNNPLTLRVGDDPRSVPLEVTNVDDPMSQLIYRVFVPCLHPGCTNDEMISINGQPPGTPVEGILNLGIGESATLPITLAAVDNEPFHVLELVLETDTDGDGFYEPLLYVPLRTVVPCVTDSPGDINEDGLTTIDDLDPFVTALLGMAPDFYHAELADVNCDGSADGADIRPFIDALAPD